jgi:hypothetical protein
MLTGVAATVLARDAWAGLAVSAGALMSTIAGPDVDNTESELSPFWRAASLALMIALAVLALA